MAIQKGKCMSFVLKDKLNLGQREWKPFYSQKEHHVQRIGGVKWNGREVSPTDFIVEVVENESKKIGKSQIIKTSYSIQRRLNVYDFM